MTDNQSDQVLFLPGPETDVPASQGRLVVKQNQARKQCGDVSSMTWWRWEQRYSDLRAAAIIISGRKYYRVSALDKFIENRRVKQEAPET